MGEATDEATKMEELKGRLEGVAAEPDDPDFLSDHTLRRYLLARDWDVSAAEKQLRLTLQWRRETKPQHIVCAVCQKQPGAHAMRQVGFDKQGRPVFYSSFSQCSTQHHSAEGALQHTIYMLENAARSADNGSQSNIWVTSCNPKLALAVEHVVTNHYPERLGAFIAVNHGALFQTFWAAVKGFICQRTASKLRVHRHQHKIDEELNEHFPDELKSWLTEEISRNKSHPIAESQKSFWKKSDDHDPRGCDSYVKGYLDNFNVSDYKESKTMYLPHHNILETLISDSP
ncbi:PITC-like protein [Mya arenaria]|uniref:PITC-like protein n=1 Tax=Mya arenaria TaxID=6604 RepID=A0ABY7EVB7_MYAAR|nr:PITC-like protein [Mya arenaria]